MEVVHGVFSSFLFWIVCGILAGYILTILVCNILYGIKCKEIEEVYLASKKVISSPESVYNNKRVLWNETTKVYDVKDIREQKGINSIGFFKENIGLSHSARYFTRILQHEKIPFTVNHFELKKDGHTNHEFDRYLDDSLKYNVNVFNFNSNYCMEYYKRFPERFNKHYNIGYGYWEFEKYPLSFLNQNNVFDEMWVSTDFKIFLSVLCDPGCKNTNSYRF